ncbi:MAG: choice-of-anchor tandem repeat GloVer-containing protein [Verrucomicrobiota bacterium]
MHSPEKTSFRLLLGLLAANSITPCALGDVGLTNLFSFNQSNGAQPAAGLVQGPDGAFYGTTETGGSSLVGTVFKITPAGAFTNLLSFTGTSGPYPGANPVANLAWGTNGNLYGTTSTGGTNDCGTIFQMTAGGGFTSLVSFTGTNGAAPGIYPNAVAQGRDGNLYGTTQMGGTNDILSGGDGTIFRATPAGTLTTLFCFNYTNGAYPYGGLVQGTNGNFYGTTQAGGTNGVGTVFEVTTNGVLTSSISFNTANGANPQAGLAQGGDGNFYGTAYYGGSTNAGTVYKMTPTGGLTSLLSFNNTNGANPYASLVQGADGNFYGTTQLGGTNNNGTAFEISPAGVLITLVSFSGTTNNSYPVAGLVLGADGYFYGTTAYGGSYSRGAIFRFAPPPNILSWKRAGGAFAFTWSAAVGQNYQVQFKTNLTQASWNNLATNTAVGPTATNSDAIGPDRQRFYQVKLLP